MSLTRFARVSVLAVAASTGCCRPLGPSNPAPLVAVREEVARSATFSLPLDQASRDSLLMFLAAGGNNDGIDEGALITVVHPDAEARWSKLLQALSDPAKIRIADLTSGSYSTWFESEPVRHVVDAREARPNLSCPPFAFTQDRFVWVFKCKDTATLGGLFVQQAIAPRSETP